MKINIIFFTSTGNTFFLVLKAKYFLEKAGHNVGIFDSVISNFEEVANCDAIGIFYPVWMSNMPDQLQGFCRKLLKSSIKRNLFFIGNCASGKDNSGSYWKKKFENKGHKVLYVAMLQMPSNFNISVLARETSEKEIVSLKDNASAKLENICRDISEGIIKDLGKGFAASIYAIQRLFFYMKSKWSYKYLKVVEPKCTKCHLCVKLCPMQNIQSGTDGAISFGKNCILCSKCFNYCPTNAVLIGKKSEDASKYHRYYCKEVKPIFYK
ncbi:MAG: EFR1 family ferrodoxin [Lentisphaerota bacterium]